MNDRIAAAFDYDALIRSTRAAALREQMEEEDRNRLPPIEQPRPSMVRKDRTSQGVYVIVAGSRACKIGVARRPGERLRSLQTGNHCELRMVYFERYGDQALEIERMAHNALKLKRSFGEWFAVSPAQAIETVRATVQQLADRASGRSTAALYAPRLRHESKKRAVAAQQSLPLILREP